MNQKEGWAKNKKIFSIANKEQEMDTLSGIARKCIKDHLSTGSKTYEEAKQWCIEQAKNAE